MASTLFGGSGGAIYMKKGLVRAGVHIILARIIIIIIIRHLFKHDGNLQQFS